MLSIHNRLQSYIFPAPSPFRIYKRKNNIYLTAKIHNVKYVFSRKLSYKKHILVVSPHYVHRINILYVKFLHYRKGE